MTQTVSVPDTKVEAVSLLLQEAVNSSRGQLIAGLYESGLFFSRLRASVLLKSEIIEFFCGL